MNGKYVSTKYILSCQYIAIQWIQSATCKVAKYETKYIFKSIVLTVTRYKNQADLHVL